MKKILALCILILLEFGLVNCSNPDKNAQTANQKLIAQHVGEVVYNYNNVNGTHYPLPQVVFDSYQNEASLVGAAVFSTWTIHFNTDWVAKYLCQTYKEGVPHEVAHLFVYWNKYGSPKAGPNGEPINGPPLLQDSADIHDVAWQEMDKKLGGSPCKEGYCPVANPSDLYSITPPSCPELNEVK